MVIRFLVLGLAVAAAAPAQLVRDWHSVKTDHFELVSRYDPALTGPVLSELEWVRGVFEANYGATSRLGRRALVYIPDSPYEFEKTSPTPLADGYYAGLPWRDIIVLRQWFNARHALFHEYTHLVLHHESREWPVWFQEGTAEYFASIRNERDSPIAGAPLKTSQVLLKKNTWLPVSYFLSIGPPSGIKDTATMQRFYTQSWLYVHMMRLSPAYKDMFSQFRGLLGEGTATEAALRQAYGKSPEQWDLDARAWVQRSSFPVERLKPPGGPAAKPEVRVIGEVEVDIARATVTAGRVPPPESRTEYSRLARLAGERCEVQSALGDLAFASRLWPQASAHYRAAIGCGMSKDELAEGLQAALSHRPEVASSGMEVLSLEAGVDFAKFMEGTGRFFDGDYEGALGAFREIKKLSHSDEFRMTRFEALAFAQTNRFDEAQAAVDRLKAMAQATHEKQTADVTAEDIERARQKANRVEEPYPRRILRKLERVDGVVTRVDCLGRQARFWVQAGKTTLKLLVADPGEVTSGGEGGKPLEFACGPQRREVIVGYQTQADAATETVGRIRYLEFR